MGRSPGRRRACKVGVDALARPASRPPLPSRCERHAGLRPRPGRVGPGDRRGDDAERPRRRPVDPDEPDGLRRQRAARVAAAARERCADVGDLGLGVLRQPALLDLQLAVARPPRPPAATAPPRARLPPRRSQPRRLPEGVARPRRAPDRPGALRRRRRGGGVDGVAGVVARRHRALVAGSAQLGPRQRRHAVDARHRLFAPQRPHRVGRRDRLGGGGGGGLRAAAQAQHPGRHRRGGGGEPGHGQGRPGPTPRSRSSAWPR